MNNTSEFSGDEDKYYAALGVFLSSIFLLICCIYSVTSCRIKPLSKIAADPIVTIV